MNIDTFIDELIKIGIDPTPDQLDKLDKFYSLLIEWNSKMNLTRIVEKEEVYLKHFYDSLTLVKVINLKEIDNLCDIGSGAGFPGIVLKIMFPNLNITLIDSLQKRVNYLNQIIQDLELNNIKAIHTRAEDFALKNKEMYDVVTARAVANLSLLSELCLPITKINGYFIAMKANANEEINESQLVIEKLGGKMETIEQFQLPFENSNRTLIKINKQKQTPSIYPKKNNNKKK